MNGPGAVTRERGTSEELAGPRCLADLEIPPSQPPRPIWVPAYLEPEFRRVVGEGIEMAARRFLIQICKLLPPTLPETFRTKRLQGKISLKILI